MLIIGYSYELKSCEKGIDNSYLVYSILISITTVALSIIMSVFEYINKEKNFLTILQDIYHDNSHSNFVQQDSIINDKGVMLAATNKKIQTWGLNNIKFCGTDEEWQHTYDVMKD